MEHRGNAGPQARVGFVIYYPFQFYVYKNVYDALRDKAEFIIDLGPFFPVRPTEDVLSTIETLLKKHDARYRILRYEDYHFPLFLERFFAHYDALVSVWPRGCINLQAVKKKKLIHMTYGAGKELTTFDLRKTVFDLILAYGKYDHEFYAQITQSVVVGNSKFDDWFKDTLDMESVAPFVQKLDRGKKTVLYLPTHSDLCSIRDLAHDLKKLTDEYNVIVKLHYYTPREEPELVELMKHPSVILLQDDTDLLPLLKISDVVVSDNSSAIFDAMLAEKPVVVTDFHSAEYLDTEHKNIRMYRRGAGGALTYSKSIEQRIKRDGTVLTILKPSELQTRVAEAIVRVSAAKKSADVVKKLFAYRDGKSGQRAAESILTFLKGEPTERPFLYHALAHYTTNVLRRPWRGAREDSEAEETTPNQPRTFSVIWIEEPHTEAAIALSLRSLVELQYTSDDFEIILVSQNAEKHARELIRMTSSESRPRIVAISENSGGILGARVSEAAKVARGDILCFTTSAHIVPSDWLTSFSVAYARHPGAGGVGGYVRVAGEHYSIFDEIHYYELGRRLGVEREWRFLGKMYEFENQLFYHNPAGDLANMSYRKEHLPQDLSPAQTLSALEVYLKASVLHDHPFCFMPRSVARIAPMNFGGHARVWYESGFSNRIMRDQISFTSAYCHSTLLSPLIYFMRFLRRYRDIRIASAAFCLYFLEYFGHVTATIALLLIRMNYRLNDLARRQDH